METIPFGFVFVLLGIFAVAIFVVFFIYLHRQYRLQRLQHPRHDYYRRG